MCLKEGKNNCRYIRKEISLSFQFFIADNIVVVYIESHSEDTNEGMALLAISLFSG
jgi:hypothetical protein